MKAQAYLNFNGDCTQAFRFYEKTFGGTDLLIMTFADSDPSMKAMCKPENLNMAMHARLVVGETTIMGSDAPEHYSKPQGMHVTLTVDTPDEADRIFNALAEGGTIFMPIQETFWARRFGMVTDRFGTPWMINCEKPM